MSIYVPSNHIMSELRCHENFDVIKDSTSVFEAGLGC